MKAKDFVERFAVERKNTHAVKWDGMVEKFGNNDLLPMWVADTEFKVPPAATTALEQRIQHGAYGYSIPSDGYFEAYANWQRKRYGTELHSEWFRFGGSVVESISTLVQTLTMPGDAVMVMEPVYYPLMNVVEKNNRQLVVSELQRNGMHYTMDPIAMQHEMNIRNVKLLLLCSPHNPVGRVWREEELTQLLDICRMQNVIVVADEIHHDLLVEADKFTSVLSVQDGFYRDNVVMLDSPSKTFNMAALQNSHVVIPNPQLRERYDAYVDQLHASKGSLLGQVAAQAAYEDGADWLDGLLNTIRENYATVKDELADYRVRVGELEGTYLLWIDMRPTVDPVNLERFMIRQAQIAVDFGKWFGVGGDGFIRMNLATTPANVKRAMKQLTAALDTYEE
ncbi:MalY/PatB family protein [Ligilactobacillus sp. LYQ60]|uniref:MalY/PatB family protein n=1 Tax=unclassified Ligilactobacillus TaxID=2767920 RepID=UPI003853A633